MRRFLGHCAILAAAGYGGWIAHDLHNAKIELAASASAEQTRQLVREIGRQYGEALETRLSELKANEIHTKETIRTEVIKPVFSNLCASDEYVRLFNESAERAERSLAGTRADTLPGKAAASGGADRH